MQPTDSLADFDDFFRERYPEVVRALFLLTRDQNEAEDLAQEAFARVYERWGKSSEWENPSGYTYSVAVNVWRRRQKRLIRILRGKTGGSQIPLESEEASDDRVDLFRALSRLSAQQQAILVLTYWLDLPSEEVGKAMRLSPSAVRGRAHRARQELKNQMTRSAGSQVKGSGDG